jgi:hypothetical protein
MSPVLLGALVVLVGRQGSAERFDVANDVDVKVLSVPDAGRVSTTLAVCPPGVVVVMDGRGLLAAGFSGALRKFSSTEALQAFDCDEHGHLYGVSGGKLVEIVGGLERGSLRTLAPLPEQDTRIETTADGAIWLWSMKGSASDLIQRCPAGSCQGHMIPIYKASTGISAFAAVGVDAALVVDGSEVILLRRRAPPTVLFRVDFKPDGVAADDRGGVFVSGPAGVIHVDQQGKTRRWATGAHGPLKARGAALFVLSREHACVIRLTQRRGVATSSIQQPKRRAPGGAAGRQSSVLAPSTPQNTLAQGRVTATAYSTPAGIDDRSSPVYRRAWFWGMIGAAVVGVAVTGVLVTRSSSNNPTPSMGTFGVN